jgi:hypothetical protein
MQEILWQDYCWQDYCRKISEHHDKQTLETLISALNAYRAWRAEFQKIEDGLKSTPM